jgi:acetyl esterase/lipase
LLPVADAALLRAAWLNRGAKAYLLGHSARDPLVSPLLADLTGLPLTLIQAASEEILRDDSRRLTEVLSARGVSVIQTESFRT